MPHNTPNQLTLGVSLDDDATFENFLVAASNRQAVNCLTAASEPSQSFEQFVYLWGNGAPGLTHLLQSACHQKYAAGAIYIPLKERSNFSPEILTGTDSLALVCIDDVQALAGDPPWEAALFTAFNALRDSKTRLIVAANTAPKDLKIGLADLHSRLQSGLVFQLAELSDEEKLHALRQRAKNRGMNLSVPVAEFILLRAERSLTALMDILDRLDKSTLQERRSLTIPLVKSTLNW